VNELLYLNSKDYTRLTPAFYDALQEILQHAPKTALGEAVKEAMSMAGMAFSQEKLEKAAARLIREKEEEAAKPPVKKPPKQKTTMGSAFTEWINELKPKTICYYLADFNPLLGRQFYYEADMLEVVEAFRLKSEEAVQQSRLRYEGSLYGFGGSYEGDSGPKGPTTEHDASEGVSDQTLRSLKSIGF